MRKIVGAVFVSLDGVIQGPGGPSEDYTGGFDLGGWVQPLFDEEGGKVIGDLFGKPFDLLLGRKTYDIFAAYWPYAEEGDPIGTAFDKAAKYVVTHGDAPLPWQNSHRIASVAAVAELKAGDGPDLVIQGSGTLYPQLFAAGLIDTVILMTFPVVLGSGKRLFGEGTPPFAMKLVRHETSSTGVVIATYQPDGAVRTGTFASPDPSEREKARQEKMQREGDW
jgi:dihydrofolate reductase